MPSTIAYKQGGIVLLSFPFTDLTSSQRHPALVVSPDSFNAAGTVVVMPFARHCDAACGVGSQVSATSSLDRR